jgi:hypothetical protein
MPATDSVTIAVEVSIFLDASELAQLKSTTGFDIPVDNYGTITGHMIFCKSSFWGKAANVRVDRKTEVS